MLNELKGRIAEIRARLEELKTAAEERSLTDDEGTEIDALMDEFEEKRGQVTKLEERAARLETIRAAAADLDKPGNGNERGSVDETRRVYTNAGGRIPDDVYDFDSYRTRAGSPEEERDLLRDGALKAVERVRFPQTVDADEARGNVENLIDTLDEERPVISQLVILTGSREYRQAFKKAASGRHVTSDEARLLERAASLTDASGGYAVPFTLDPTVILTNDGAVNPIRSLARVVQITTNQWNGVSSAGITASYDAEATEVSDDTPTLAQPSVDVEKAQAFVPFSIEIGQDWAGFDADMAMMLNDARSRLEATKFALGSGSGSNEPAGVITGATVLVTTATTAVLALSDIYNVQDDLPARWEDNASWLAHKAFYNKVKQLAQAQNSAPGVWTDISNGAAARLLDDPVYKTSVMSSSLATSAEKIAVYGDFRQYVIVDRVGMSIEYIPHLFATANNRPSGQRGIYAYWRNGAKVLVPSAFRVLKVL